MLFNFFHTDSSDSPIVHLGDIASVFNNTELLDKLVIFKPFADSRQYNVSAEVLQKGKNAVGQQ